MLRVFFTSLTVCCILWSCSHQPQSNTFKEKYNVYAELERDEQGAPKLPFENEFEASLSPGRYLVICDVPIDALEAFADAIVRRMDAKTLSEYLALQDEIERFFHLLVASPSVNRADEKYGTFTRWAETYEDQVKNVILPSFFFARDEESIREMVFTVRYARYLMSVRDKAGN